MQCCFPVFGTGIIEKLTKFADGDTNVRTRSTLCIKERTDYGSVMWSPWVLRVWVIFQVRAVSFGKNHSCEARQKAGASLIGRERSLDL